VWPDSDETVSLLTKAKDGEDDAMHDLLERHRRSLRQMIALRMDRALAARLDASDIIQDTLVEANRRFRDYLGNPQLPFHLWLRQIAQDRLIDAHRRHRVAQKRSVDREQSLSPPPFAEKSAWDLAAQLKDPQLTPAAATIRKEFQSRFFATLQNLSEEDREIVLMRHFEHLGNGEVALALGISAPAAGMRYLRALRKLKEQLGDAGF